MDFEVARQIKFDAGAKEHHMPWDLEHISYKKEIQDELLDLYNYASLDATDRQMSYIMVFAKNMWEKLEKQRKDGTN
jgi:hypothetical protein